MEQLVQDLKLEMIRECIWIHLNLKFKFELLESEMERA